MMNYSKNCFNCRKLEYFDADSGNGNDNYWYCAPRDYRSIPEKERHLKRLDDDEYKIIPKKCCVRTNVRECKK